MEARVCTVQELLKSGRLKKGDYIEYAPAAGRYVTSLEDTGWGTQIIETDLNARWIVHDYDEEKKIFSIKTEDRVNDVSLRGSVGFVKGPDTLHAICKECYSIPEKGIYARSMVVEDYNEETGFVLPEKPNRFAFYPCGSKVSGEIEYNGKMYKKVEHGVPFVRFYMCDGGGKEKVDKNGSVYRKALKNKPIFVTETHYYYENIINISKSHWLASPCVDLYSSYADFRVHYARSSNVSAYRLYRSDGDEDCLSLGVRPLVSLSSMLHVDITDEHRDGSSPEKAWKIVEYKSIEFTPNDESVSILEEDDSTDSLIEVNGLERMVDLVSYESLNQEIRERVDKDVKRLGKMKDKDIMQYGWDIQTSKNQLLNDAISQFQSMSVDDIEKVIDEIMNSGKSLVPRKHLFGKVSLPTYEEKCNFAGKVGDLEQAIKAQIKGIFKANKYYLKLILECKSIVDNYAICIMAMERYLASKHDTFLEEIFRKKIASLKTSRVANMQSAIMYMTLYRDNALLVNRLYEIINVNLYQLQEQILIQSGISDLKRILNDCRSIRDSISNLTSSNISELTDATKLINSNVDESAQDKEAERLMKELVSGLKAISSG